MKYAVVYVPDLPGCVATGASRKAVEQQIREAIVLHLDGLRHEREPIPEPTAWTELVEASL